MEKGHIHRCEKKELFCNSFLQDVRRTKGERYHPNCISPSVTHGGGALQVWGAIIYNEVGHLHKIDGMLTADKYRQFLIYHDVPSGKNLIGNNFVFQH